MKIRCTKGGTVVDEFEFEPGIDDRKLTFGRSADSSVRIDGSPAISRVQATLIRRGAGWALIDGGESGRSATGCWVDGVRVGGEVPVFPDQRIMLFDSRDFSIALELASAGPSEERTEVPVSLWSPTTNRPAVRSAQPGPSGTATIREEIGEIQNAIGLMRESLKEHGELIGAIGARLDVIHKNDVSQDAKLRKVIGVLTGLLCVVVVVTSGRHDADDILDRVLSVVSGAGALGGGWSLIKKDDRGTGES